MDAHPGLPLAPELVQPHLWVSDIVYFPLQTALVRLARERGCRVLDGGGMAVFQAVGAFELFSGIKADPNGCSPISRSCRRGLVYGCHFNRRVGNRRAFFSVQNFLELMTRRSKIVH